MARFLDCSRPRVAVSHQLVQLVATFSKSWQQRGCHSSPCALLETCYQQQRQSEAVVSDRSKKKPACLTLSGHGRSSDVAHCWWMLDAIKEYERLESSWVISRWVSVSDWVTSPLATSNLAVSPHSTKKVYQCCLSLFLSQGSHRK